MHGWVKSAHPDDANAVGSYLLRRQRGQSSGEEGHRIPSGLGWMGSGGGGTGRDVSFLTASLCSEEYHHSRNLSKNTPRGMRLEVIRWRRERLAGVFAAESFSSLILNNVTPSNN